MTNKQTITKMEGRDWTLDILRILSCILVIGIHTVVEGWYDTSPRTYSWTVLNFYDTLCRPGVPLFFMISGCLFLRRDRIDIKRLWLHNILRLTLIYYLWVFFYAVMNPGLHKALADPMAVVRNTFGPYPQFHLWFLRKMIFIYALAPLLHLLARAMDRKMERYFLGLFLVFGLIRMSIFYLPFLPSWIHDQMTLFEDMDLMRYCAYFMIGYILSRPEWVERFSRKCLLTVYVITVLLAAVLNQWISWVDNWPTDALYGDFALPVCIEACCLFLLARKRFSGVSFSPNLSKWILRISESTLFVYLIHWFVIRRLQIYLHFYIMKYNVLFSAPLMVLLVFIISSLCGMILERIPLLRRIL